MFRTRKAKDFQYRPRYWDADKERLEERRKTLERETAGADKEHIFRSSFDRSRIDADFQGKVSREIRRSNRRLIVVIFVIALIVYLIFKT